MADEQINLTKEQRLIANWAKRTGVEMPPSTHPIPDKFGLIRGSGLKFTLGGHSSPEDTLLDNQLVSRMRAEGWDVKSSKDGMSWEWVISAEKYYANLNKQHQRAIENVKPKKQEIVNVGEDGYFEEENTYEINVPMTVEKLLEGHTKISEEDELSGA